MTAKAFAIDVLAGLVALLPDKIHDLVKQKRERDLKAVEAAGARVEARSRNEGAP